MTNQDDTDPCGTGVVGGLDPLGDGFLAVKAGPGLDFDRIDKLHNGAQVFVCGQHGPWFAVVYSPMGDWSPRCGISMPWPRSQPYTGPCGSGWVHRRWVGQLAG